MDGVQDVVSGLGLVLVCVAPGLVFGLFVTSPLARVGQLGALLPSRMMVMTTAAYFLAIAVRGLFGLAVPSTQWAVFMMAVVGGTGAAALVKLGFPDMEDDDLVADIQENRVLRDRTVVAAVIGAGAACLPTAIAGVVIWSDTPLAVDGSNPGLVLALFVSWQAAVGAMFGLLCARLNAVRQEAEARRAHPDEVEALTAGVSEFEELGVTRKLPACAHCGYWLREFEGQKCPECGRIIDWGVAWSGVLLTPGRLALRWAKHGAISGVVSSILFALGLLSMASMMAFFMMLGFAVVFVAPAVCFGIMIIAPLLQAENPGPYPRTRGVGVSLSTWMLAAWLADLGVLRDSAIWLAIAATAAGALSAVALEHYIARQSRPPLTTRRPIPFRTLCKEISAPLVNSRRLLVGIMVGGIAAGVPTGIRALLEPTASLLSIRPTFGDFLCLTATFVAWQAGIAAVLGLFRAELNPLAAAAPETPHAPPD